MGKAIGDLTELSLDRLSKHLLQISPKADDVLAYKA
jgi:hypothetical protein